MKQLIEFFGKQGLFADLCAFFVLVVGVYSLFTIERKVMPNVDFEVVTVRTIFPGASAEEVERLITSPLEQELKEVEGIKTMRSTSIEGSSVVVIQLDPDQTTVDKGRADIQNVVERFNDLPDEAEAPLVTAIESKLEPVMIVSVSSQLPESDIREAAKLLERELERVAGVAKVTAEGLRDIEYRVEASPAKLQRYQLTLDDIVRALEFQNLNVPGGVIEGGHKASESDLEITVRTIGKLASVSDVEQTVVRANALGEAILVKDVAKVFETYAKPTILLSTNGQPSMNLTIVKSESADAINVVDSVKAKVKELQGSLKDGIATRFVNDSSYYIRRRLNVLSGNLLIGLALVLIILSLVMPWRVALITAVGIPFSFLGTMYFMDEFNISFNIITMMGLIIVVGMLVDDALVVTENVVRLAEKGMKPVEASIKGTQQIWAPVAASVLTTIVAFMPMMNMSGIFGKFIKYIPIAVILALVISLYECFFILPHHLGKWGGLDRSRHSAPPLQKMFDRYVVDVYVSALQWCVRHRYITALVSLLILVGSVLFAVKKMNFVLFPKEGVEAFVMKAEAPIGTPLEKTREYIQPIEKAIAAIPADEMDDFTTTVGEQGVGVADPSRRRGSHYAQSFIFLKPELERQRSAQEIIDDVRAKIGEVPQLERFVISQVNPGPPTGKPVSIGVQGRDYEQITVAVEELKEIVSRQPGVFDVIDSFPEGNDEVQVMVKKAEAAAAGLSVASIGRTVRAAYEGLVATTIRLVDEEIDVRVSLPLAERASVDSLEHIQVPNTQGKMVALARVADFERKKSISSFEHENNRREIRVFADINDEETSSTKVNGDIKSELGELQKKFPQLDFVFGGEIKDTDESLASLFKTGLTALLGIVMILILTFKNLYQPILVVVTIPLGIISIIWAFGVHGMPISFLGIIGMVALAGVIVNNSIVFIDFINQQRAEGQNKIDSIVEAGRMRIRPIFLTTMTTVCGILPTAYGLGGLDQFVVPVAMALGWGLFFGSIQAVFVLPALVAILDDVVDAARRVLRLS